MYTMTVHPKGHLEKVAAAGGFKLLSDEDLRRQDKVREEAGLDFYSKLLAGINASRKHCGLAPLTAAELPHEFVDLGQLPQRTKLTRRESGNLIASRQGIPTTQEGIDGMHAAMVAKLNATVARPVEAGPGRGLRAFASISTPRSGSRAPQGQAEIDAMHAEIVARLNAEAGLKTPARARAR
jgi:hypothetical protein